MTLSIFLGVIWLIKNLGSWVLMSLGLCWAIQLADPANRYIMLKQVDDYMGRVLTRHRPVTADENLVWRISVVVTNNTNSSSDGNNTNSLKSNEYDSKVWENIIGIPLGFFIGHRSRHGIYTYTYYGGKGVPLIFI